MTNEQRIQDLERRVALLERLTMPFRPIGPIPREQRDQNDAPLPKEVVEAIEAFKKQGTWSCVMAGHPDGCHCSKFFTK